MLQTLLFLLIPFTLFASNVPDLNLLEMPLNLSIKTLETLLATDPSVSGFIPVSFRESIEVNANQPTKKEFFQDRAVLIAMQRFENFSKKVHQANTSSIPHVVHLIWLGSIPPLSVDIAIASWKKYHPDWEIKLWTDNETSIFSWSSPRSEFFFNQVKSWSEKSDILRFEILYQYGGIYADVDVICLKAFDDLLPGLRYFACFEENRLELGRPLIGSAIIGASPNHPIIKHCLEYHQTKQEAPHLPLYLRSGPGPITKASLETLESNQEDILILPPTYFYPLPWRKRLTSLDILLTYIRPESFAIHLWQGTWKGSD